MSHYNTTHEPDDMTRQYNKQTATQDNRIAAFFESNPGEIFTPWEVQAQVFPIPPPPITSVRRSMSDLTKAGILTKTTHKKEVGGYGRRSYAWTLNEKYRETQELIVYTDQPGSQELLHELDKDLGPQAPSKGVKMGDLLEPVLEGAKKIRAREETVKDLQEAVTPQGLLFDVTPLDPICCSLCGRELTGKESRRIGIGPVCYSKCY